MRIGNLILIVSITLIIVSILGLSKSVYNSYKIDKTNYKAIYNYVNNIDKTTYDGVLEIPVIDLKTGIVTNVDNGLIFVTDKLIAGHSGNCDACYFNSLDKLEIGDNVYLYKDKEYRYKVDEIREVDKDNVHIRGDLSLVTCLKRDKDRRLLINLRLINVLDV